MSKKCLTFISIFLVLGLAGRVSATTFYCDPASGSMSNDGSSGSPWSTLQAVFDNNKIESCDKNLNTINSGSISQPEAMNCASVWTDPVLTSTTWT